MSTETSRQKKRRLMTEGARTVFAREGYSRAPIDVIAVEGGVSTRTLYNHFTDKQGLFSAVLLESSGWVKDALFSLMGRHLDEVTDAERALVGLAGDWFAVMTKYADHFAMIRHLSAESGQFPEELLAAWREAGPLPTRVELARRFGLLAAQGLIVTDDPGRAAGHFMLLAFSEVTDKSQQGTVELPAGEAAALVTAGVRTFLYGFAPRSAL